jgi:hypothetical protein
MGEATRPIPEGLPSWSAFGAALLRPSRPRLAEALSVATGVALDTVREALASPTWDWMQRNHQSGISWDATDPSGRSFPQWAPSAQRWTPPALWESLATRGLIPDRWVDDRSRRFHGGGRAPATVTEAVLLAADAEGVALAEALAREAVLRRAPWFEREPPRTRRWRRARARFAWPSSDGPTRTRRRAPTGTPPPVRWRGPGRPQRRRRAGRPRGACSSPGRPTPM